MFLDFLAILGILHHVVTATTKAPGGWQGSVPHLLAYCLLMLKLGVSGGLPTWDALDFLSHEAALISYIW